MKIINKMQRKFGRYAIPNLMAYIIGLNVIGFIVLSIFPDFLVYIYFDMSLILKGQVWRLISFLLIPPAFPPSLTGGGIGGYINMMLFCLIYWMIGNTLERVWGAFRLNLYMFGGILLHIIAGIIVSLAMNRGFFLSTAYLNSSLFFALAAMYPDMQFYFYFVIPIRAKWLAIINGAFYAYEIFQGIQNGNWASVIMIVVSLLNFIIFFFATRDFNQVRPKEIKRRQQFKQQVTQDEGKPRHKCAVCGRTEKDGEDLEFRYCSKCEGAYEYCQDHLYTHKHVTQ